jgi:hypothetical protein
VNSEGRSGEQGARIGKRKDFDRSNRIRSGKRVNR